jgi:hypothetical protein
MDPDKFTSFLSCQDRIPFYETCSLWFGSRQGSNFQLRGWIQLFNSDPVRIKKTFFFSCQGRLVQPSSDVGERGDVRTNAEQAGDVSGRGYQLCGGGGQDGVGGGGRGRPHHILHAACCALGRGRTSLLPVLRIRSRIRICPILMFLGLLNPDPDPSITKQK